MKPWVKISASVAVVALVALVVLAWLTRGTAHSGPSIAGNLRSIQLAKEIWLAEGGTNEWPTAADLFSLHVDDKTGGVNLNEIMRQTPYGEIYFINRTGAPPFAYIPKAARRYRGGEVLVMTSNGLAVIRQ